MASSRNAKKETSCKLLEAQAGQAVQAQIGCSDAHAKATPPRFAGKGTAVGRNGILVPPRVLREERSCTPVLMGCACGFAKQADG